MNNIWVVLTYTFKTVDFTESGRDSNLQLYTFRIHELKITWAQCISDLCLSNSVNVLKSSDIL